MRSFLAASTVAIFLYGFNPYDIPTTVKAKISIQLGNTVPRALLEAERLKLSERDSLRVLALLENPPPAPDRLVRAAKAGFTLP